MLSTWAAYPTALTVGVEFPEGDSSQSTTVRFGAFLPVAVACNERLLRVDLSRLSAVRRMTAFGATSPFDPVFAKARYGSIVLKNTGSVMV